jgi:hypothetical protein
MPDTIRKNQMDNDHDLLIRLDENMRNLTHEVKKLGDDTIQRINIIEKDKVDVSDFEDFKKNLAKEIATAISAGDKTHDAMSKSIGDIKIDLEIRMRAVERFMYIAMGVTIVVDIILIPVGFFLLNKLF